MSILQLIPIAAAAILAVQENPQAEIQLMDGTVVSGRLMEISADAVQIDAAAGPRTLPRDSVMTIALPAGAVDNTTMTQQILLRDGSQLNCQDLTRSGQKTSAAQSWIGPLSIPDRDVKAVRLQAENTEFSAQWQGYLDRISETDMLIVSKRSGDGLDFLAGTIVSIDAEKVAFLLDGDTIPVPPARVYGIVFGAATTATKNSGRPSIQLTGPGNQVIGIQTCTLKDQQLSITTTWNQQTVVAADRIRSIDFSSGRIRYVSDLPWLVDRVIELDPPGQKISLNPGAEVAQLEREWYRPQRDGTFEKDIPIRLRGRQFRKGFCLRSKSEIRVALDREYVSLEAIVGVDDEVAFNLKRKVGLTILGDDTVLFTREFVTDEAPVPVRVPLENVATLTILVDFADNDSSCDWLDLADARLQLRTENSP
ncbi:MAG: NPCBM/NEW2 domain-containing protein [Planctomycetaceae bacterium]|nr:NPCBM/NEW2 domain-containing protein [Planctomycetaceae bacterium]